MFMSSDHSSANDDQTHCDNDKKDETVVDYRPLATGVKKLPDGEWFSTERITRQLQTNICSIPVC